MKIETIQIKSARSHFNNTGRENFFLVKKIIPINETTLCETARRDFNSPCVEIQNRGRTEELHAEDVRYLNYELPFVAEQHQMLNFTLHKTFFAF